MYTRQDYLNKVCTHQQYYLEIAQEVGAVVTGKLLERCKASTDANFNDIPLSMWDTYAKVCNTPQIAKSFKDRGDYTTLAGLVCLFKCAAEEQIRG